MIIFKRDFDHFSFKVFDEQPKHKNLHRVKQVHGKKVVSVPSEYIEADGLFYEGDQKVWNMAVLTADCLPVVALGRKGYGLVHAGWKGVSNGILLTKEIKRLVPTHFFIGPHIHSCCYEVQEDFMANFKETDSFVKKDQEIYFDLAKELKKQLELKYPRAIIEVCKICTCCNQSFHSYRRDKTSKRNWNILEVR